jgi:hypothetical protein
MSAVNENQKGHETRQFFERVKEARKSHHIVGAPTMDNFKSLLWMNIIKNCLVTTEDVNVAEKMFGPDVSSLKGKSTRCKPKPVRKDLNEIPKELIMKRHDIKLCMDVMCVNECSRSTTAFDQTIKFQSLVPMNARQHKERCRGLNQILRHCNHAGFVITETRFNGEHHSMTNRVKDDLDVQMNFTNAPRSCA